MENLLKPFQPLNENKATMPEGTESNIPANKLPAEENKKLTETNNGSGSEPSSATKKVEQLATKKQPSKKKLTKMNTVSYDTKPDTSSPDCKSDQTTPQSKQMLGSNIIDWSKFMSPKYTGAFSGRTASAEDKEAREREKKRKILSILGLIAGYSEKKDDGLYCNDYLIYIRKLTYVSQQR